MRDDSDGLDRHSMSQRLHADFNGLFSELLCLSHEERCLDVEGCPIDVYEGMPAEAFESDVEDGEPVEMYVTGTVERAPEWMSCRGSRWVLRRDSNGLRRRPRQGKIGT